jgi:hypothetical protein
VTSRPWLTHFFFWVQELSTKNVSIGVVGVDRKFEIIENDALQAMFDEAIVEVRSCC